MRGTTLFGLLAVLSGCWIVFDDGGSADDQCIYDTRGGAELAPAPKRDPQTLTCQAFGGDCNPACGPCLESLSPEPSWGICGSPCEALDETACTANAECRVVKDARCAISLHCLTDFLGCFPIDTAADPTVNCIAADAWTCSRSNTCTALHRVDSCPQGPDQCPRTFGLCVPEGRTAGQCFAPVTCNKPAPPCPADTKPGVQSGCYTGACIPVDLCELVR